jgi:hypothetical protein
VDIEVFSLIRRDQLAGVLDETAAALAVDDLRNWPGERYGHRALLGRAWELRDSVRLRTSPSPKRLVRRC